MNSTLLIIGIVVLVIGIIMLIIGIVVHENNVANNQGVQPWWVWFLIIAGIIIAIVGGFMMAFSATRKSAPPPARYQPVWQQPPPCYQPPKPCPTPCGSPTPAPMMYNPNAVAVPTTGYVQTVSAQQPLAVPMAPSTYPAAGYPGEI